MTKDSEAVANQIGRQPRGEWKVAERCSCGLPQVIETHPLLQDGTPFPTTWWLSCKKLSAAVSRLESDGMISRVNERLNSDAGFKRALEIATKNYVAHRDGIVRLPSSSHPGGGPDRVKCLHAHVADHLVTGNNPVGSWVLSELEWSDPAEPCVETGQDAST